MIKMSQKLCPETKKIYPLQVLYKFVWHFHQWNNTREEYSSTYNQKICSFYTQSVLTAFFLAAHIQVRYQNLRKYEKSKLNVLTVNWFSIIIPQVVGISNDFAMTIWFWKNLRLKWSKCHENCVPEPKNMYITTKILGSPFNNSLKLYFSITIYDKDHIFHRIADWKTVWNLDPLIFFVHRLPLKTEPCQLCMF